MEQSALPSFFLERLNHQYGELTETIICGFSAGRATTLRVNRLKSNAEALFSALTDAGFTAERVPWFSDAFALPKESEPALCRTDAYQSGKFYLQSLSSMLPPLWLDAQPGEDILDMAAAPGGKTTEIASLTAGKAQITACERNPIRAEKLQYNLQKQGVHNASVLIKDARQIDDFFSFDRILLDAPCSGSGTLDLQSGNISHHFTEVLVKKSVDAQIALLKKAMTLLKKGGTLIYSTCSVLKEENEDVVSHCLNDGFVIEPIVAPDGFPLLPTTIDGTICLCPDELFEGFFVARIKRIK